MPLTHQQIEATVHAYLDAFNRGDAAAATALYAADGLLEDPVGGQSARGAADILAFYQRSMAMGAKLHLTAPICSAADTAAFAFYAQVDGEGGRMRIDVVELQHLDAEGKITHMKAYFSEANMHQLAATDA
jgi:steroid delta-isomerase